MQQAIGRWSLSGLGWIFLDFFPPTPWLVLEEQAIQCMTHGPGRSAKRAMQMGQGRVQQSTAMASRRHQASNINALGTMDHHGTLR